MSCSYYNPNEGGGSNCGISCQSSCESSCQESCQESCQTTCEKACQTAAQKNRTPTTPANINTPTSVKGGSTLTINWAASSDADGNLAGYRLERSVDNGTYTQIYQGTNTTYTDSITQGWLTVRYRVRAYDAYSNSAYQTSPIIAVVNNTAPTISGVDTDMGGLKTPFNYTYQVDDIDANEVLTIVEKLNGTTLRTITNANKKSDYTVEINKARFDALVLDANNTIEIEVTDSKNAITYRRVYFRRINAAPSVTLVTLPDMGLQNEPFDVKYKVDDAEKDAVSVRVLVGDTVLDYKDNVELNTEQTYTLTKLEYLQIDNGEHTIRIEATDVHGAMTLRTAKFRKNVTAMGCRVKKDTATRATQITVKSSLKVTGGNVVTYRVCNNANDANPTWEIIQPNTIHIFANTTKTAETWAVASELNVDRGTATEDAYLYGKVVSHQ